MGRRRSAQYEAVLASERWRQVRAEAIRRAGYRCIACGRGGTLDVHHARGYRNLGREQPEELQALCRECHEALHVRHHARRAGCLRTLVWIVVMSFAIQLAATVVPMLLLRQFGLM